MSQVIDVSTLEGSMAFAAINPTAEYIPQGEPVYAVGADGRRLGAPWIKYVTPQHVTQAPAPRQTYGGPSRRTRSRRAARHAGKE